MRTTAYEVLKRLHSVRPHYFLLLAIVGLVALIEIAGRARTHASTCPVENNPTVAKDVDPSDLVTLSAAQPLIINYGHHRGQQVDETTLNMKTGLEGGPPPSGPIAVSHSLLERADGSTSSIAYNAVSLSAFARGNKLRVVLCVDTTADESIQAGRYLASASIDDRRFGPHDDIPIEVTLQTTELWTFGAPLAAVALILGIIVSGGSAGKSLSAVDSTNAVVLFVFAIGATFGVISAQVIENPSFGSNPITHWGAFVLASLTAVTAAADGAFMAVKGVSRRSAADE